MNAEHNLAVEVVAHQGKLGMENMEHSIQAGLQAYMDWKSFHHIQWRWRQQAQTWMPAILPSCQSLCHHLHPLHTRKARSTVLHSLTVHRHRTCHMMEMTVRNSSCHQLLLMMFQMSTKLEVFAPPQPVGLSVPESPCVDDQDTRHRGSRRHAVSKATGSAAAATCQ